MRLKQQLSDISRQQWLDQLAKTINLSPGFGIGLVPDEFITRGANLQTSFEAATTAKQTALSDRRKQIELADQATAGVQQLCRAVRDTILNRTALMGHSKEVYKIYGMDLSGKLPRLTRRWDWLKMGEDMLKGDALAITRGYPPLGFPDPTTLAAAVDNLQTNALAVDEANLNHQDALELLIEQRRQVDLLFSDIRAWLVFTLRAMSASRRREIMRRYGYVFDGDAVAETGAGEPTTPDVSSQGEPEGDGDPIIDPEPTTDSEPSNEEEPMPEPEPVAT